MNLHSQHSINKTDGHARVHGWILSVVGHAIILTAAVMTYPAHDMREPPELFRWNVQLVTSALSSDSAPGATTRLEQQPTFQSAAAPRHERMLPQRVPMRVTRQIDTRSASTTRIVETAVAQVTRSRPEAVHQRHDDVKAVEIQRVEHPAPLERENHEEHQSEVISRKDSPIDRELSPVQTVASTKPFVASSVREERTVETRTPVSLHPEAATSNAPPSDAPTVGEGSSASLRTDTEQPIAESLSGSLDAVGSESASETAARAAVAPGNAPVSSASLGESTRPDYGWLAGAIRERIEEIKGYSAEARDNEWEGRVLVAASIKADGHIVNIRIVESSGNGRLDADAKAIVGYASPLVLSRPLGAPQVTVKVPIIFGLQ